MDQSLNPTLLRLLRHFRLDRAWTRAEGCWLTDTTGRRFLDCYAQYGAIPLGHNAECVREAIVSALDAREPTMVQPYRAPHAEALARELTRRAPGNLSRCVFTTSGAEAVEAAIKLVRARTGRPVLLSAEGSFHGKTLGALAATGQRQHADGFGPAPSGFERVPFGDAKALEAYLARNAAHTAGFLLEPIQGERGVHAPPPGYLGRVRELCTSFGVPLVLDEIQTGLGRTGRLFACEHENVVPDVLLVAKGLGGGVFPLGACLATPEVWDETFALRHSSTFANNDLACRVGLAVLGALDDATCAEIGRKGSRLLRGLDEIAARYPATVAEVRGRGLLCAVELAALGESRGAFLSFVENHGLYSYAAAAAIADATGALVLPTLGESCVLRVSPPLTITDGEIDEAIVRLEAGVALLDRDATGAIVRATGALEPRTDDADDSVIPVPRRRMVSPRVDYAFLVHYTSTRDVVATDPALAPFDEEDLRRYCAFTAAMPPGVIVREARIRSAVGAEVTGAIIAIPMLPEQMRRIGRRRVADRILAAVDLAAGLGARIVGLGGYTAPYSRRGTDVVNRGPAITTGNALTAGMTLEAIRRVLDERRCSIAQSSVAVVGARGSVGALCARLIACERPERLVLVGNPESGTAGLHRLRDELTRECPIVDAGTRDDIRGCDVVVTATGAGRAVVDVDDVASGAIVCDVARPPDTSAGLRARLDVTVFDGGLVALSDASARFGVGNLQGLPDGIQLACLAETILLALDGETRDFGVGDDIPVESVDVVMRLADFHGFRLAPIDSARAMETVI